MVNESYYDDLRVVSELLEISKPYEGLDEMVLERRKNLSEITDSFTMVLKEEKIGSPKLDEFYKTLTSAYVALVDAVGRHNNVVSKSLSDRARVARISNYVFCCDSGYTKLEVLLDPNITPTSKLSTILRLCKEVSMIGFTLSDDERVTVELFENIIDTVS